MKYYPLNGHYHPSVATRLSQLHLVGRTTGRLSYAKCKPFIFILDGDNEYDEEDAEADGRSLCQKCLDRHAKEKQTHTGAP